MRVWIGPALLFLSACCGLEPDPRSRDPYARYLGVKELGERRDAASVAEIVRLLEDPHYLVVMGAVEALGMIGHKEFIQHVAPQLKHRHPMVRAAACVILAALRNEEAVPAVIESLQDPDAGVRRSAVKSLPRFGRRPDVTGALAQAVGDKDPGVSLLAHEALQGLTGMSDVERKPDAWTRALKSP
jgi:HEAT repeat protein